MNPCVSTSMIRCGHSVICNQPLNSHSKHPTSLQDGHEICNGCSAVISNAHAPLLQLLQIKPFRIQLAILIFFYLHVANEQHQEFFPSNLMTLQLGLKPNQYLLDQTELVH